MRKWISILLVILLTLGFAACGKKNKKADDEPVTDPAAGNEITAPETGDNDPAEDRPDIPVLPGNDVSISGGSGDKEDREGDTEAGPDQGNVLPDPGLTLPGSDDPADDEDIEGDGDFTGLDSEDETIIDLEENQGVGGF